MPRRQNTACSDQRRQREMDTARLILISFIERAGATDNEQRSLSMSLPACRPFLDQDLPISAARDAGYITENGEF